MQVRIANRQDEPGIRTFVESIYQKSGSTFDLEGNDSDLRNIEANFFGKEGLIIVAEADGNIVGIAGARRKTDSVLELTRLTMSEQFVSDEVVSEMLGVIINFARRLLYARLEIASSIKDFQQHFTSSGFNHQDASDVFFMDVASDY